MTQYLPIKYREFYFVLIQAKKTSKVPGPFFLGTQKYKALFSLYLGHFSGCFLQESILRYEVMSPSGIKSTCVLLSYCIKELFFQAQWSSIFMQTQSICSIHQDTHCVISMELRARESKQILMLLHLLYCEWKKLASVPEILYLLPKLLRLKFLTFHCILLQVNKLVCYFFMDIEWTHWILLVF